MFFVQEGFTYRNFLMDMIAIFAFVVWFWLLVVIYGDLFRRHDISGWVKALWVLALFVTSYWLHPSSLLHFPAPELAYMLLSPVATVSVIVGCAKVVHRLALSPPLLRFERRLGVLVALAMGLFLTGAALWVIEGGPGPRNLFHIGAINVIELVLLALTLYPNRTPEREGPGLDATRDGGRTATFAL